jgi:hypothetical protein
MESVKLGWVKARAVTWGYCFLRLDWIFMASTFCRRAFTYYLRPRNNHMNVTAAKFDASVGLGVDANV